MTSVTSATSSAASLPPCPHKQIPSNPKEPADLSFCETCLKSIEAGKAPIPVTITNHAQSTDPSQALCKDSMVARVKERVSQDEISILNLLANPDGQPRQIDWNELQREVAYFSQLSENGASAFDRNNADYLLAIVDWVKFRGCISLDTLKEPFAKAVNDPENRYPQDLDYSSYAFVLLELRAKKPNYLKVWQCLDRIERSSHLLPVHRAVGYFHQTYFYLRGCGEIEQSYTIAGERLRRLSTDYKSTLPTIESSFVQLMTGEFLLIGIGGFDKDPNLAKTHFEKLKNSSHVPYCIRAKAAYWLASQALLKEEREHCLQDAVGFFGYNSQQPSSALKKILDHLFISRTLDCPGPSYDGTAYYPHYERCIGLHCWHTRLGSVVYARLGEKT